VLPTNTVPFVAPGLVVALQYWEGDRERAFRLARLIADIEPIYRGDVTLVLAGRFDVDPELAFDTVSYCNAKMRTFSIRSNLPGTGHPDGSNDLWCGTMEKLASLWVDGDLDRDDVFTVEADGCPVSGDWIYRILDEHQRTLDAGRRITGAFMPRPQPHINGTLVCSVPWWIGTPSLRRTPNGQAWDVFHRATILAAAARSDEIRNIYGASKWTDAQLRPLSRQAAWLSSTKDDSAITWAEGALVE
jgi:hypothetical protein